MKSSARMRSFASRAAWYISERSASICFGAFGRCTLTTTRRPFGQRRAVHLADRRRGERHLVELGEQPLDRLAELLADRPLDIGERERPHVVLKAAQLGDDVRRHDVGPRREQLAELDERRAELVEHLAQVPAARGALDRRIAVPVRPSTRSRSRAAPRPGRSRSGGRGCAAWAAWPRVKCCTARLLELGDVRRST